MKLLLALLFIPSLCFSHEVRIAVLDTGLTAIEGVKLCQPVINLTNSDVKNPHGDNVTHVIADGLKDYCVIHIRVWAKNESHLVKGIYEAIRLKADIINISGGGHDEEAHEKAAIRYADFKHVIVVAAAGNEAKSLAPCYFYPACYPSVVAIGNLHSSSNYGSRVDYWMKGVNINAGGVKMTGTSQAAAMFTHELAKRIEGL